MNTPCRLVSGPLAQLLVAISLLLTGSVAIASDATCAEDEKAGLADNLPSAVIPQLGFICYGVPEEQHPLTQEIRGLVDKDPNREKLATALRTLARRVEGDELYGRKSTRDAFAASANHAADDVAAGVASINTSSNIWHVDQGKVTAVPGLNLVELLNQDCPTRDALRTQPCQDAMISGKAWIRVVQLADASVSRSAAAPLGELLARSSARLDMWHAYRDEALPQFQCELLLNSWRLDRADKGKNGRERDPITQQPMGPMQVPTDQIIFLHPGVGLEYRDKPDKPVAVGKTADSKTSPLVYLEFLGRYRWSWDESNGKMLGGSGVSLVATYADRDEDTKVGYGLLFHLRSTKAYTLGITRSGDSTNVVLNVDLADFFKDKLSYWQGVAQKAKE